LILSQLVSKQHFHFSLFSLDYGGFSRIYGGLFLWEGK